MKKMVLILILLGIVAGNIFAQETVTDEAATETETIAVEETADIPKERKNAVSLNLFPLFKGFVASETSNLVDSAFFDLAVNYERLVVPHISIGADIDAYFGKSVDVDLVYFNLSLAGRYYFMSEKAEKFYLGALIGFNVLSVDEETSFEDGGFGGFYAELQAGYRLFFTEAFFVEPSVSYVLSKAPLDPTGSVPDHLIPLPSDWEGGLSIGVAF
jgi:hypothetical protein